MAVRQRGSSWQVDIKVQGQDNPTGQLVRVRETVKTEREGVRLEALIRADIIRTGRWSGDPETSSKRTPAARTKRGHGTLRDAIELAWDHPTKGWKLTKAGDGQKRNAEHVADFLGPDTLCAEIDHKDFARAAAHFAQRNNSSDTVTRKLQALYRALWFAQRQGWIKARPEWDRPAPGKPRQFVFSAELEPKVEAYFREVEVQPDMADLFVLGVETGCRLSELLGLEAQDLDTQAQFLLVRGEDGKGTKNGDIRSVVLSARALGVLNARTAARKVGRMFPGWTTSRVSRLMQMARAEFGYEGNGEFTFHATRHTCGTRMAERGVPLVDMMDQLGHRTAVMTKRYIKLSPAARRATILKSLGESHLAAV